MAENEPTEAEMAEFARQMQEQLRTLTAGELLSQTGVTLVNVAAARLGMVDGVPDDEPHEARAAIDALGEPAPGARAARAGAAARRAALRPRAAAHGVRRAVGRPAVGRPARRGGRGTRSIRPRRPSAAAPRGAPAEDLDAGRRR